MNVSLNQLRRFVDLNEPAEEIEKILVKLGLEVESVEHRGMGKNDGIVVARIVHFEPHPHADRLRLCRVDMGDGELRQIVCGATNFRENDCVPLALPGAVLPGNVKIKKAKLRGIESEGMLCSGRELGLNSDQNGLLILKEGYPLGMKIHDVFPESDTIFSLEFTANRGDVLSHYGVARELAAWYNIPLAPIKVPQMAQFDGVTGDALAVEILSKDCELYTAIVLKNIRIGESVDWIRRDLEAVGVAVVNNIVDLTNWIMVTYGQPLHAFDRSKVGRKIMVRGASSGEKIRALDGKEYELNPSMLLICDENHPLGIAGVMGGEETKITENTTEIILESAYFVADSVRRTSRSLGINSDSAYRYARHVDPAQTENFQKIAVQMLVDLYGAKPASPIILAPRDAHFPSREIELDPNFVRKIFGFPVEDGVIFDLLVRLQYTVHRRDNGPWIVESPTYRWDVLRPIDLVEECLRIYGVDKIPSPITAMKIFPNASCNSVHKKREIIQFLAHNRFVECYNYSMVRETENALPIANPLIENQTHLRTSLIPGLVDVLRHNLQNGNKYAKFFEFGHVFRKLDDAFEELISVAFLLGTDSGDEHWEPFVKPTFFTVKNLMCHLWSIASDEPFTPVGIFRDPLWEEKYAAKIGDLGKKSVEAQVGYLSCEVAKEFKMSLIGGEIFIKIPLFETQNQSKRHRPFFPYPAAKRDIALIVDDRDPAQDVVDEIQSIAESIAKDIFTAIEISVFDVYRGENVATGKKSLGLNLLFRNERKTPSEGEIDHVFQQLISHIRRHPHFQLRG